MKITLQLLLLPAVLLLINSKLTAQTITFTSTPATKAVENTPYICPVSASINNTDKLEFSTPMLPSWLSLSSEGASAGTKINSTELSGEPGGVAGDAAGNYYVVGNFSGEIYKITPDGTTTTWAQKSTNYANYGALVVDNYLYVSHYNVYTGGISRFNLNDASPVEEWIYNGSGMLSMCFRDGAIYVADYIGGKIGKLTLNNNSYSEIASVSYPFGLGFNSQGELLIASYSLSKIYKFSNGVMSEIISELPSSPTDVKIDANNNVYVSFYGTKIRKYNPGLSTFVEVSGNTTHSWGMTLTSAGTLIYGDYTAKNVYTLQTGAVLSGTPSHSDVGTHNVKVVATNGTVSEELQFTITVSDPNKPVVTSTLPVNAATDVPLGTNLTIQFNEEVVKGTGNLYIRDKSTNEVIRIVEITSQEVTVSGTEMTISGSTNLPSLTEVYVTIDDGAIKDVNSNAYAGISGAGSWGFTTIEQTQAPQTLTFDPTKTVAYGSPLFDPGASSDAGLDLAYSSSNEAVAIIVNGKIKAVGPGVAIITATQAGNENYLTATPISQELTVTKKQLHVSLSSAPAISKVYDGNNSVLLKDANIKVEGIVDGDEVDVTGTAAFLQASASAEVPVLYTNLTLSGKDADKYTIANESTSAIGSIVPAQLLIKADDKAKKQGTSNPIFTFSYSGFVGNDNVSNLEKLPTSKTPAGMLSPIGVYPIVPEGAASSNYKIGYTEGKLTITPATTNALKAWSTSSSQIQVRVFSEKSQKAAIMLYTDAGQPVAIIDKLLRSGINEFSISTSRLTPNIYIIHAKGDFINESQRIQIK